MNTNDNVTLQCHTPRVIIQTVASEDISSISQTELAVDTDLQSSDFPTPPDALEADTFPDEIHQPKMTVEPSFNDAHVSKFSDQNSTELINSVMVRTEEILDTRLKQEAESPSHLASAYVTEVSPGAPENSLPGTSLEPPLQILGRGLGGTASVLISEPAVLLLMEMGKDFFPQSRELNKTLPLSTPPVVHRAMLTEAYPVLRNRALILLRNFSPAQ